MKKDAKWIADLFKFKHDLVPEVFYCLLTSASFATLCATVSNWPALNQVKNIVCSTVSWFTISSWEKLSWTPSADRSKCYRISSWKIPKILLLSLNLLFARGSRKKLSGLRDSIGVLSPQSRLINSRSSKIIMKTLILGKRSLKNSFLHSLLSINRNWPFFKLLPLSAANSLSSESSTKSVPTRRLFLQRNTYVRGLVLHQPTIKAQWMKNLSWLPRLDATSNLF